MTVFLLYSHNFDQLYKHICMQNHNDTIKMTTQFFRKIYLSLYWKGCVWEGVGDRTELPHIDLPTLMAISVSFPFSRVAQPEARGPSSLLGAGFLYHILSPNWSGLQTDWISCVQNCDTHKKKVGVNYYITECTGNSISLETRPVWRQDVVEKASTQ